MSLLVRTALVLCFGLFACKVVDVVGEGPILCEQMSWAQCEDFDDTSDRAPFVAASYDIALHVHSHVTLTGVDCATSGDCTPYLQDGTLSLNPEDAGYGMDVLRFERPFDFAEREGHIHYRSDLKGHPRMHQTVHVSPMISNTLPDLRANDAVNESLALTVDFIGGDGIQPFSVISWKDGEPQQVVYADGPLELTPGELHDIDVYVSRTRTRLLLDGASVLDEALEDIGFDRGYVYFGQIANDPVKEGYSGDAANRFLWDDLAFDGPLLPRNSLTPADQQDVLFRAWNATACSVRGLAADGPVLPLAFDYVYNTWHVQLDGDEPPVGVSDISCSQTDTVEPPESQAAIGDIEIFTQ